MRKYNEVYYPKRQEDLNSLINDIQKYKYVESSDILNDMVKLTAYIEWLEEQLADLNFHWS